MSTRVEDGRQSTTCGRAALPAGGPLSQVRVVELGSFIAGPFCGQCSPTWGRR